MSIHSEPQLNAAGNYVLGVGADIFSVFLTQPLDTVTTYVMSKKKMPFPGLWLWRGVGANSTAGFVQGGIPFMVNGLVAQHYFKTQELTQSQLIANGIFTGLISAGAIAPFERAAKLQQLQGGSMYCICKKSLAENGVSSFFKATAPIAIRDSVVFGTFFGGRKVIENNLEPYIPHVGLRESAASISTGFCAGVLSTPPARLNVLMQGDTKGEYPTIARTFTRVVKEEGARSLFKGALPRASFMAGYIFALGLGDKAFKNQLPSIFYQSTTSKV